jgi:hypothetical protein
MGLDGVVMMCVIGCDYLGSWCWGCWEEGVSESDMVEEGWELGCASLRSHHVDVGAVVPIQQKLDYLDCTDRLFP